MYGRQMLKLLDGKSYTPGTHQVSFDMGRLPAGVYSCHLQASGYTKVEKLIKTK
jgi:hypothetical protein